MKVNSIDRNFSKVTFGGYRPVKDNYGFKNYEFNFPFDEDEYDCYLELFNVKRDVDGNYVITDIIPNLDTLNGMLKLKDGKNVVDISSSYFIPSDTPFAYHYKLVKKGTNTPQYCVDAGDVVDNTSKGAHEIYNIVTQSGSNLTHGGSMKLVSLDNFKAGYIYNTDMFAKDYIIKDDAILKKAMKSYKHFSNKIGGTLAGLEKAIDNGEFDGYSGIISLPLFTDDSLSPHAYWNKNCMQMAQSLGNINNYASLQRKMFAKGLNFVSDGAFVNEGLEGIHFSNVLKWGDKSPYINWFKAPGLQSGPLTLGVFGKNQEFVSHKIVNSPYTYIQGHNGVIKISRNGDYDSSKPTYVQVFDSRLVSDEQKYDTSRLIESYDKLNTKNPYEINTHNDTIINYSFEINPETYNNNIKNLNEYNKKHKNYIQMDSIEGTRFLTKFENFELEEKFESGFETWDANPDIAKLNYVYSHATTEDMKNLTPEEKARKIEKLRRSNIEVQDYVISSGAYWTQKTRDILTLYIAQNLRNLEQNNPDKVYSQIIDKIYDGVFPIRLNANLNKEIVKNVLTGQYETDRVLSTDSYYDQVKMGLMNFPLDSIELGDNIVSAFASPYISKRAAHEDEIGVSKYDLYKMGNPQLSDEYRNAYEKTQKMYDKEMTNFAVSVLDMVQKQLAPSQRLSSGVNTSLYGKYVLPILTAEIAKFAVIKAINPEAEVFVNEKTGEIGYDYKELKDIHLQTLGIHAASPEDEALSLISAIRSGIGKISSEDKKLLADAIAKSIAGTNIHSFTLADMIIDRSQAGLDWRIDATKDIADIDALRNGNTDFDYTWKNVNEFWKKFNDNILKINPNAYLVAEVTDEAKLHETGNGANSAKYKDDVDIRRKLLNETGLTAIANYRYFFTDVAKIFGKSFEDGTETDLSTLPSAVFEKMIGKDNYLRSSNLNSLIYSYTFVDNHDKPRALHCLALDMGMFYADLQDPKNYEYRERAYRILEDKFNQHINPEAVNNYDFSRVSPKALAMADAMISSFGRSLEDLSKDNETLRSHKDNIYKAGIKAIVRLAKGEYLGKNFDADAFGVKPFDITIEAVMNQMKYEYNRIFDEKLPLSEKDVKQISDLMFEKTVDPAFSKLLGIMKYLVALPGKPTIFAGDDLGATGYEEKTKNIYLQNRNYLHNEWLKDPSKEFVAKHYNELNEIMSLRSRSELDALNNGAPFTLPLQQASADDGEKTAVSAILRQNTDGKMAVVLFNAAGINHDPEKYYSPKTVYLNENRIYLDGEGNNIGIKGGLIEGAKFINANNPDDVYYVHKYNDGKGGQFYALEHHDNKSPVTITDSTMILYHVPDKSKVSFTGSINYKPQYNFVSKAYEKALV